MNRREFLANAAFIPIMDDIIKSRKDTKTIETQRLIIRSLWLLSQQVGYGMWVYFPTGYWKDDIFNTMSKLQIHCVTENGALVNLEEQNFELSKEYHWLNGNWIDFNKLPEVINVYGNMWPIVELFRLEKPVFKFDSPELSGFIPL